MAWWIWILIGVGLLALEFTSTTLHIGLFAVGAFVVAILVAVGVDMPLWAQLVIFTGVSLFSFFFLRPVLVRKLRLHETKTVDSLIGENAVALDEIKPAGLGKAEMRGTTWSARNVGETVLLRGQRCVVAGVEGLVIHVRAS
jgi:membrane protein implicated in regulation of membrane protease activity